MAIVKQFPAGPFYAVIFVSEKSDDLEGYAEMDEKALELASQQPGYLGYVTVSNGNHGIFISYWESREHIERWKHNATHALAKSQARKWYKRYLSQVCKVEHSSTLGINF